MRVYNVRDISGYVSHEPSAKIIILNHLWFYILVLSSTIRYSKKCICPRIKQKN